MAELRASGNFGSRPLVVLTGSKPFQAPEAKYSEETAALNHFWFGELQPRLASLSTHGHMIVQDKAEEPGSIVEAVREVVSEVRQ